MTFTPSLPAVILLPADTVPPARDLHRTRRMIAIALLVVGLGCIVGAVVMELRRGEDPRVSYLQARLNEERSAKADLIEKNIQLDGSVAKMKGLLSGILVKQEQQAAAAGHMATAAAAQP